MKKIAVLISGGGTNLQSLIDAEKLGILNGKIEIVFSNRKNAYGLTRAKESGIDTLYLNKKEFLNDFEYNQKIISEFELRNIDLVVLAGYLNILTDNFIKRFDKRIINIHPSLIPSFCGNGFYGSNVHKAVIKSGVKYTGATTHLVDENVDSGYIIAQDVVKVSSEDDYESIAKKVLEKEHKLLVKTVKAFCEDKIIIKNNRAFIMEEKND